MIHFITEAVVWHYTKAFHDLVYLWRTTAWFLLHFFSLPTLLTNLKQFNSVPEYALRILLILMGGMTLIIHSLFSLLVFLVWTIFPLIIIAFFVQGIRFL